jgi:hypothetical protein
LVERTLLSAAVDLRNAGAIAREAEGLTEMHKPHGVREPFRPCGRPATRSLVNSSTGTSLDGVYAVHHKNLNDGSASFY